MIILKIEKSFVDVVGPFVCLQNGGNSPPKKNSITSMFILMFFKKLDKFMMISKIELKFLKIYLMLKLFMCLRLELLELF
jgi:hypothetical protein